MQTSPRIIYIPTTLSGQRIDQALAALHPEHSRAECQKWVKNGYIVLDNKNVCKVNAKVYAGQRICVTQPFVLVSALKAEPLPLHILYEDEAVLVINKAAGMVVHPGAGNPHGTLVNALLYHCPALIHIPRAGLVHRLDKDTTGLLLVAKTAVGFEQLTHAMKLRSIKREYQALVNGRMTQNGTVNAPIGRHPRQRTKMAILTGGRTAITHYTVSETFKAHSLLHIQLETGRTHQIRVHMQHIQHPIVGDQLYKKRGNQQMLFPRQALHAFQLTFVHPESHIGITCKAPIPPDMQSLLDTLRSASTAIF